MLPGFDAAVKDVSLDDDGTWDLAVGLPLRQRADVDQDGTALHGRVSRECVNAPETRTSRGKDFRDPMPEGTGSFPVPSC